MAHTPNQHLREELDRLAHRVALIAALADEAIHDIVALRETLEAPERERIAA